MKTSTVLNTIGNTPVVELTGYSTNPKVKIFAKLEGANPGGSVKDRTALSLINDARDKKLLSTKKIIIEATSGNTGIALAMISAVYGYKFIAVMPESVSIERRKLLTAYGADIILTDGEKGTNESIATANQLLKDEPDKYISLNQFGNKANIRAHYTTTGVEILRDTPCITHFVAGMGTGGTLMGTGQRLKEHDKNIKIIGVQPNAGSKIQGLRNMAAFTPPIFKFSKLDSTLNITVDDYAFDLARDVSKNAGISVGISSGAALWGAIELSKTISKGVVVTVFADRGDRYISTDLFK